MTPLQVSRDATAFATWPSGSSAERGGDLAPRLADQSRGARTHRVGEIGAADAEALVGIHVQTKRSGGAARARYRPARAASAAISAAAAQCVPDSASGGSAAHSAAAGAAIGSFGEPARRSASSLGAGASCAGIGSARRPFGRSFGAFQRASGSVATSTVVAPLPSRSSVSVPSALSPRRVPCRDRLVLQRIGAERRQRRVGFELAGRVEQRAFGREHRERLAARARTAARRVRRAAAQAAPARMRSPECRAPRRAARRASRCRRGWLPMPRSRSSRGAPLCGSDAAIARDIGRNRFLGWRNSARPSRPGSRRRAPPRRSRWPTAHGLRPRPQPCRDRAHRIGRNARVARQREDGRRAHFGIASFGSAAADGSVNKPLIRRGFSPVHARAR